MLTVLYESTVFGRRHPGSHTIPPCQAPRRLDRRSGQSDLPRQTNTRCEGLPWQRDARFVRQCIGAGGDASRRNAGCCLRERGALRSAGRRVAEPILPGRIG